MIIKQIFKGLSRMEKVSPPEVASGWDKLTYNQLVRYEKNRAMPKDSDFAELDQFYGLLSIMTGVDATEIEAMPAGTDDYLASQLGWLATQPKFDELEPPKQFEYKEELYEVPTNLELLTNKQMALIKIKFDSIIEDGKVNHIKALDSFPFVVAVFLDRLVFGSTDEERIMSISEEVRDMPAILVYPIGSFFLSKWAKSIQSGRNSSKSPTTRTRNRRGLVGWLRSGT